MLAEHYGFLISPCRPCSPEHKGGVEKDMDYVKRNFLPLFRENQKQKGFDVPDLLECKKELARWGREVDDQHIIKYVGTSPEELFSREKTLLQKQPQTRWDRITWYTRKVYDDWKIQVKKVFYTVPYRYIGKKVSLYINSTEVVIFYEYEEIARHIRSYIPWDKQKNENHGPPGEKEYFQTTSAGVKQWARSIGLQTAKLVDEVLSRRGIDGLRPARGICCLVRTYGSNRLEAACKRALYYRTCSLQSVKKILKENLDGIPVERPAPGTPCQLELFPQHGFSYAREGTYYDI